MSKKKFCSGSGGAILFLGICVGFIVIVYLRTAEEETVLQVSVKQGVIAGYQLTTRKGRQISAFEGIPYAAPPTGDLRFRVCRSITAIWRSHITFTPLCKTSRVRFPMVSLELFIDIIVSVAL
jgi:hypothetical protein